MQTPEPRNGGREKILLVDDVPENLRVLAAALEPEGHEILVASGGNMALKIAARARPNLIVLDIMMPEMDGFETCRRLKADPATSEIPVIFITAREETEALGEAFRAGAVDYIVKPFNALEAVSRAATHLRIGRLTRELTEKNRALELRSAELSAEIGRREKTEADLRHADTRISAFSHLEAARGNIGGLIGESEPIRKVVGEIHRLHEFANTSVLILGESGTGKELVARAIHFQSPRAKAPFVPVNCVAIPAELAESILFGHVKGSFTGAIADRKGCFELADGGTLFLDEIGDMPAALQAKLLRVLEDGRVTPIGAVSSRRMDVRVIAATNVDIGERIAAGTFRQDLYFRLARYTIRTPSLRERKGDIRALAEHFLRGFAGDMGRRPPTIAAGAVEALKGHDFPGNIRELKNIVERAFIESGGREIQSSHLGLPERSRQEGSPPAETAAESGLPLNVAEAEEILIKRALDATGGNIAEAARLLGVHRTRIYRKLAQEKSSP